MRPYVFFIVILSFFIFFQNCADNATGPKDPVLKDGTWLVKRVTIYFGPDSFSQVYDPSIDDYYNALFIQISGDEVHAFSNLPGPDYDDSIGKISGDMIIFNDPGPLDTMMVLSFSENRLVLHQDNLLPVNYYFIPFSGDIPPVSWISVKEDDNFEPDNDKENATNLTVGTKGQMHTLTLYDQDMFSFSAEAGTTYQMYVTSTMDDIMTLYNDALDSLITDDDNDHEYHISSEDPDPVECAIVWQCTSSGMYYIKVKGLFPDIDEGDYRITLEETNIEPLGKSVAPTDRNIKRRLKTMRPGKKVN